jgi:chemotaxis protein MotB
VAADKKRHHRHEEHEEHEEHVNHEAWVIPYADMLTLLMALFLVLFAIGRTDAAKSKLAADSFKRQLDGSQMVALGSAGVVAPIVGGAGVLDNGGIDGPTTTAALSGLAPVVLAPNLPRPSDEPTTTTPADRALANEHTALIAAQSAADSLIAVEQMLEQQAQSDGISGQLGFSLEARGLVVTIVTDQVLFQPGRADLQPGGVQILDLVGQALATIPNNISIEGHTDSKPISNARFPSNWELSTARATSVLRYLVDQHHMDPARLSAAGFSDTRPIGDNATPEGAARNRRVEIVVLATVSLAPVLAPSDAPA